MPNGAERPPYNRRGMPAWFPLLLATHIVLAISLFLPSILLPFALRTRRAADESPNPVVRFLLWMQAHGTVIIGIGLALTGAALRPRPRQQPRPADLAARRPDDLRGDAR